MKCDDLFLLPISYLLISYLTIFEPFLILQQLAFSNSLGRNLVKSLPF